MSSLAATLLWAALLVLVFADDGYASLVTVCARSVVKTCGDSAAAAAAVLASACTGSSCPSILVKEECSAVVLCCA